jgi:hypothetical protein
MGKQKPKKVPLTEDQREAIHLFAAEVRGQAFTYMLKLEAWHQGAVRKRPDSGDLDPEVARCAEEFLDAVGLKAEEVIMEPYDLEAEDGLAA